MKESQVAQLEAVLKAGGSGGKSFSDGETQQLLAYYRLVLKWNKRLHLTTLTEPEQFFQRHILESLLTASYLISTVRQVWDLGSGLGIPGVPIAVFRSDLSVHLVESSRNKALFLEEVVATLGLTNTGVVPARIELLEKLPADACLMARAVEKMERILKQILRVGQESAQVLILGNVALENIVVASIGEEWTVSSQPIAGRERGLIVNIVRST